MQFQAIMISFYFFEYLFCFQVHWQGFFKPVRYNLLFLLDRPENIFLKMFFILPAYINLQKTGRNCRIRSGNNTYTTTCYSYIYSTHSKTAPKDQKYQFLKIDNSSFKKGRSSKKTSFTK